MSIRDYDGTTTHQIGSVRDYDGTTTHQIGSVRDYDGTTTHLIYSAEEQYFAVTTPSRYSPGGAGGYTANSTNWSCNVSNGTNSNGDQSARVTSVIGRE